MAKVQMTLEFEGYYLEEDWNEIPESSGVYCIYACTYNRKSDRVSIRDVLYIGESDTMKSRISENPKKRRDVWSRELDSGEVFCASYSVIGDLYRERAEAALIYMHKPKCNKEYKNSFPFDTTIILTTGRNSQLNREFSVYKTR